jgi:hypothetical protein
MMCLHRVYMVFYGHKKTATSAAYDDKILFNFNKLYMVPRAGIEPARP